MPAKGSWGQGWREIELITTDDLVASRDENNPGGAVEWKAVEELFQRTAGVITLTVNGREIRTTSEHPFYHAEKGWLPAGDLATGDRLVGQYGEVVIVNKVEAGGEYEAVYNLRVADWHTYFVGDEGWGFGVWAHNQCGPDLAGEILAKDRQYKALKAHLRLQQETGLTRISPTKVFFDGVEVRSVRPLSHLTEAKIRHNMVEGLAPRAPGHGDSLVLHHHKQQVQGPTMEMRQTLHQQNLGNRRMHPLGNDGGLGNGPERTAFNAWKRAYWKARYHEELLFRGLE